MEELVLGLHLAGHELDVVHQHEVRLPVLGAELIHGPAGADGLNVVVDELVALDIEDFRGGEFAADDVSDGVEQVGLAQPRVAVDEKGVVVLPRRVRHRPGRTTGQTVGGAHHKGVKGKLPALHQGYGLLLLLALKALKASVVQQVDGDVGGEDVLESRLNVGKEAVLDVGALEGVGTVEVEVVSLQGHYCRFVEPCLDGGLRQILPEPGQDHGPDIGNRLHRSSPSLFP